MRTRSWTKTAALALVATLLLVASACGGGGDGAEVVSQEEPETEAPEATDGGTDDRALADDVERAQDELDDLGMGELGECMEIGLAYASISLGALGAMFGADQADMEEMQRQLEEVEADLPSEIADDFQTISDAFAEFAEQSGGLTGGNIMDPDYQQQLEEASAALESPEVTEAQANIESYLERECPDYATSGQ